jgi:hypothetical protein
MATQYSDNASPPQENVASDNPVVSQGEVTDSKSLLNEHKGKLAIGVAATLGIMVFYKWREKLLAKEDPEDYARLQRLKAGVRTGETRAKPVEDEKSDQP